MPSAQLYNMAGEKLGEMELPSSVFGIEPNGVAMHAAVKQHLANLRQGTQSTLTRAEVSGGGRKPWRQKGTGRARQGSTRAPQWTHGGVVFAPKPRDYSFSLNRKYKRLALLSALSDKAASGDVIVIDHLDCAEIKTKPFAKFLAAVGADKKAYVVTPETRRNVVLSARNIPGVRTQLANLVNTYDILDSGKLVIDRDAVSKLEEVFGK
ncbi:MAG: 50S ribosomal protein L4 [Eubacteriales bacterium]